VLVLVLSVCGVLFGVAGCASDEPSDEDRRRLEQLAADPLLPALEMLAPAKYQIREPGRPQGQSIEEHPTWVSNTYEVPNPDAIQLGLDVAAIAAAHGWSGVVRCTSDAALLFGTKPFGDWQGMLDVVAHPADGTTTVTVELTTPHVPDQASNTRLMFSGGFTVDDACG
jgi:hypothetical protein